MYEMWKLAKMKLSGYSTAFVHSLSSDSVWCPGGYSTMKMMKPALRKTSRTDVAFVIVLSGYLAASTGIVGLAQPPPCSEQIAGHGPGNSPSSGRNSYMTQSS